MFLKVIREKTKIELDFKNIKLHYSFMIVNFDQIYPTNVKIFFENDELTEIYKLKKSLYFEHLNDSFSKEHAEIFEDIILKQKKSKQEQEFLIDEKIRELFSKEFELKVYKINSSILINDQDLEIYNLNKKAMTIKIPDNNGKKINEISKKTIDNLTNQIKEIAIENVKELTNAKSFIKF